MDRTLISRAAEVIFSSEGGYSSVNADDNGALSVGKLQWHGTRALRLVKKIVTALGEGASLALVTPELYREIISARTWSERTLSTYEKVQLMGLLSTEESHSAQDAQAEEDVAGYLEHALELGVTEQRAMIFLADIENQGGAGAASRIAKNAPEPTLDGLFVSARGDRVFSRYMTRRERVYALLAGHAYGEEAYDGILHEVRRGDTLTAIAREYSTTVRAITEQNGITDPNRITAGALLRIPHTDTTDTEGKTDGSDIADSTVAAPEAAVHRVVRGDTLSALSREHGCTVAGILSANRPKYPAMTADYIVVGWELVIPRGSDPDARN